MISVTMVFSACNKHETISQEIATESQSFAKKSPAIWADCIAFGTVGTNTSFKPTAGPFDRIFTGANFLDGMNISETKPGDQDFNGGRWHVWALKSGVDPDKYNTACSFEDLDINDFMPTTTYFECPLLPLKGNSSN